jgi:hypothetical protein
MAMENLGDPGSWGIIPVLIRIAPGFMGYACGLSTVGLLKHVIALLHNKGSFHRN